MRRDSAPSKRGRLVGGPRAWHAVARRRAAAMPTAPETRKNTPSPPPKPIKRKREMITSMIAIDAKGKNNGQKSRLVPFFDHVRHAIVSPSLACAGVCNRPREARAYQ